MKKIRNNALKALVVMALISTQAFADGDMGGGGFADPNDTTKTGIVYSADGDMGGGGRTANGAETVTYLDSVLKSIYDYFGAIL